MSRPGPTAFLTTLFEAAIAEASAARRLAPHLPLPPRGRTVVVGAGKAAAAMARAVEQVWTGPLTGLVITRYGHAVPCDRIEVVEAAHPVSDAAALDATRALLATVDGLTADDLVLCLLSGGGSSLMTAPPAGVSLDDKRELTRALLRSGASIREINTVRKHVSLIKGGRLAVRVRPARLATLAISDVPGDDPGLIASGPTAADFSTSAQARAILDRFGVTPLPSIAAWLRDSRSEAPVLGPDEGGATLIATPAGSLQAAARRAGAAGYAPWILGDALEGEARDVARDHARLVAGVRAGTAPVRAPCAILSGGETTVTVRGRGRGGRNAEFLLALALALDGAPGVHALAADTDGIDGSEANAGAVIDPDTLARLREAGVSPERALADNDAYGAFAAIGALVVTGPTLTNVNDFRAILIEALPKGSRS